MKFIKYSFRFFRKFRSYTLLNITGITIAIILLISGSLFFATQLTYDNFHSDYVYRVQLGKEPGAAVVFPALAEGLKSNFSAITETTRLKKTSLTIQYGNSRIADIGSYYVDGSFFDVLTYKHLYGKTADLKKPHTAFISEALAERLAKDPASLVGETLLFPKKHGYDTYTIAGILENVPRNSHLQFDMLVSYSSLDEGKPTFPYGWAFKGVYTYIKASTPLQITSEQSKQFLSQQKTSEQNNSIKSEETLDLVPITEVHYLGNMMPDEKYGNQTQNYALLALFIMLLVTLVFNFYGSSLILSHFRSKALKLKKIFGATSERMLREKLTENILIAGISFALAAIIFLSNENFFSRTFNISRSALQQHFGIISIGILVIVITFVFVPGIQTYLYAKNIDFKGRMVVTRNIKNPFAKVTMVQVAISLMLIVVSLGIYKQVTYIDEKNNIIETENIVVIDPPQKITSGTQRFFLKNELERLSFVRSVALSNTVPFNDYAQLWWGVRYKPTENFENEYAIVDTDKDFFNVYEIEVVKGRPLDEQDGREILVNEKFLDVFLPNLNEENFLNQEVILRKDTFVIKGVVENYYHLSSKNSILPAVYRNLSSDDAFLSVRFAAAVQADELQRIGVLWNKAYPGELFAYSVLTDGYEKIVGEDIQLLSIAGLLALSICILSLLALAVSISMNMFKKQKEFALRKILGAHVMANLKLAYREYALGITLAWILASPFSNMALRYWLNNYVDKTEIPLSIFLLPYAFFLLSTFAIILFLYTYSQRNIPLSEKLDQ